MRVWRTVTKAKPEPPGCQRAQTWGPWHHHFNPVTCQVSTGFGIWGGGVPAGPAPALSQDQPPSLSY